MSKIEQLKVYLLVPRMKMGDIRPKLSKNTRRGTKFHMLLFTEKHPLEPWKCLLSLTCNAILQSRHQRCGTYQLWVARFESYLKCTIYLTGTRHYQNVYTKSRAGFVKKSVGDSQANPICECFAMKPVTMWYITIIFQGHWNVKEKSVDCLKLNVIVWFLKLFWLLDLLLLIKICN